MLKCIELLLYSRPRAKHFVYVVSVNPVKLVALSSHLADEETQGSERFMTCLKSMNVSFEFEPDSTASQSLLLRH